MVAVEKQVASQGCGPCVGQTTYEFEPRRSPTGELNMKKFAKTTWCSEDVKTLKPEWTHKKCREVLSELEDKIVDAMVAAGWQEISYRVQQREE